MNEVDQSIWRDILPTTAVFTTRDVREATDVHRVSVSRRLGKLADHGIVVRIRRGLWAVPGHPDFSPYAVVPHLFTGSDAGYVSLLSALHLHGMIEQIPPAIHVVTTRQREDLQTPVGEYEFHQIQEALFGGHGPYDREWSFQIADREKALFDIFYLSVRKGRRFSRLPELDPGDDFSGEELERWIQKVEDRRLRSAVRRRARRFLAPGGSDGRSSEEG